MIIYLINPFNSEKINLSRIGRCVTKAKADYLYPPTELLNIASYLRKEKYKVKVIDGALYKNIADVKRKINNPSHFIIMVGIYSYQYDSSFIRWLKNNFPFAQMIVFGQGASFITENYSRVADYVVYGEPEKPILQIIKNYKNIKGVSYKKNGRYIINKKINLIRNLDDLPYPARDLIDNKIYKHAFLKPFAMVYSSRGCPYKCTFCTSSGYSPIYRVYSVNYVIGELTEIYKKYRINNFGFMDETFTLNKRRVIQICQAIIDNKLKMTWIALSRVDTVDEEMLIFMKRAGCKILLFGIESFDQKVLDSLNKKITVKQIKMAIKVTKKVGIKSHGFFIFGSPEDTVKKINKTIKEAKRIDLDYASFNTYVPYPGTRSYYELERQRLIKTKDWFNYDQSLNKLVFKHRNLNDEIIKVLVKKAYREFYLNPRFIGKRFIEDILNPKVLLRDMLNLKKIIINYFI